MQNPRDHRALRTRRMTVAYDDTEFHAVAAAAAAAGPTPTGFVTQAAVALATQTGPAGA